MIRRGAMATVGAGILAFGVGALSAEPAGTPGATYWSPSFPYWCSQAGEGSCRRYTGPDEPTGDYISGCNGLYLWHTHTYVVYYCGDLPWS